MFQCLREAQKEGCLLFPVTLPTGPMEDPTHEYLTYNIFKEVKRSIKENGLHSPYTHGMVEAIGGQFHMTPWDWKVFCKTLLTPAQNAMWLSLYRDEAGAQAVKNLSKNILIAVDMLNGEGDYATLARQTEMDERVFEQCSSIAAKCWKQIPEHRKPDGSFVNIRQGPTEPYMDFID